MNAFFHNVIAIMVRQTELNMRLSSVRYGSIALVLFATVACGGPEEQTAQPPAQEETTDAGTQEETDGATEGTETPADEPTEAEEFEPVEVRIGTFSEAVNYWCLYVAEDEGFFEDQGIITGEHLVFQSDDELGRALFSGEVDIAYAGFTPLVPIEQGQVDGISLTGSIGDPLFAFMSPNDIQDVEDLRGQTVALQPPEATAALYAKWALDQALGEGNWSAFNTSGGTGARVAAMQAGEASAALANSPAAERLDADDDSMHLLTYVQDLHPGESFEIGAQYASDAWLQENEEAAIRFYMAQEQGCRFLEDPANRESIEQGLVEKYDLTPELAAAVYEEYMGEDSPYHLADQRLNVELAQNLLDLVIEAGVMEGTLDLNEITDHSFVDRARERLDSQG